MILAANTAASYLPHRQLRNIQGAIDIFRICYLPHRQLRNQYQYCLFLQRRYLPHRQLRNIRVPVRHRTFLLPAAQAA